GTHNPPRDPPEDSRTTARHGTAAPGGVAWAGSVCRFLPWTASSRRSPMRPVLPFLGWIVLLSPPLTAAEKAPRARDLGVPFDGTPGPLNANTDVKGIEVGHATLVSGEGKLEVGVGPVRTGVTAILPRGRGSSDPTFAGWFSLNGNGEMTGTTWVEESGFLEGPVMLTNTASVGTVRDATIKWLARNIKGQQDWSLPVVAETYDGHLNDTLGFHVKEKHVFQALDSARGGGGAEGNVGGGTGRAWFRCQGRDRDRLAEADREAGSVHGRRAGSGELRAPRATPSRRRAGRPGDHRGDVQEAGNRVDHHRGRHRRSAAAAPVEAARSPRLAGACSHGERLRQRVGRPLPRLLDCEP